MIADGVHTKKVPINTLKAFVKPCITGFSTSPTAPVIAEVPIPTSLANTPRRIPIVTAEPTIPPKTCSAPKADFTIKAITLGSSFIFTITIIKVIKI